MHRIIAVFSLALFFVTTAAAQELTVEEHKALVAKLQARRASLPALSAEFTEERTTRLVNKPIVSNGTLAFQAPNKFRREVKGISPSLAVCTGSEVWLYYPNFKEAEHYTLGQRSIFDDSIAALTAGLNFDNVEKFFRLKASREGSGYRAELTPKSSGIRKYLTSITVSLDAEGDIQRSEATLPKGDRVVTTFRNVRGEKQSGAKFEFAPPAGVNVTSPLGK